VVKRAVNECKTPPRLLYFIVEFHRSRKGIGLSITGGALFSVTDTQDEELEHQLTKTQTMEALSNWLNLLNNSHPDAAALWRTMLNDHVFTMAIQMHTWEVQLEYILLLRSNSVPHGVGPPIWDWPDLWTMAKREADARTKAAHEQSQLDLQNQLLAFTSSSSLPIAPNSLTGSNYFRTLPAKTDNKTRQAKPPGIGPPPPFTRLSEANATQAQLFCFICGARSEHHWKKCEAATQINGGSLRLRKNQGGNYVWSTGHPVCYNWNGVRGCDDKPCTHGSHLCTLCQAPDHGAFKCTSK
jgi:hypothetical protein